MEPQAGLMILANEIIKLPPDTDKPVKLNPQTVACSEVSLNVFLILNWSLQPEMTPLTGMRLTLTHTHTPNLMRRKCFAFGVLHFDKRLPQFPPQHPKGKTNVTVEHVRLFFQPEIGLLESIKLAAFERNVRFVFMRFGLI